MKAFIKWADSRTKQQTIGWVTWLVIAAVSAFFYPPLAAFYFGALLICIFIGVRHHSKTLTALLIASLLFVQLPQRAAAEPPQQSPPKAVECNAVIIGGVVIVVGVIVTYKLVQFCKKHFPTPPPQPPPDPGTNNPSTNGNNNASFRSATLNQSVMPTSEDISTNGWMDTSVPANPVPYQDFIILSFNASTNLTTWTNAFTLNLWLSSNSTVSVLYDASGLPIATNRALGNPYTTGTTNRVPLPSSLINQPQLFLKDW